MRDKSKILSVIFPSNRSNYEADSIFVFNRILFTKLLAAESGWSIHTVGPSDMPPFQPEIDHHRVETGATKYQVRFGFPWEELRSAIADVRPDVLFVNMPEQAAALRVLCQDELHLSTRIVTYVHYIPANVHDDDVIYEPSMSSQGNGPIGLARLIECLYASDLVLVCSSFAATLLTQLANRFKRLEGRVADIRILNPPIDIDEVPRGDNPSHGLPTFAYNHRLYDEYGTNEIIALLDALQEEIGDHFRVLVTNPTAGRSAERTRLNPGVERNISRLRDRSYVTLQHFSDRSDYYAALQGCCAGIAPIKQHALWSMSVVDMLALGRPVVAFDIACFSEIGLERPFLVRDAREFGAAMRGLALGEGRGSDQAEARRRLAQRYSGQQAAACFGRHLAQLG